MYKMNSDPVNPANNFVTEIAEHTLLEVEVVLEDNRNPEWKPVDFVFFIEDDNDFTIKERCEKICQQMGYTLKAIGEYKRISYTYDVARQIVRLTQQS